jgi:hypothetical protein
MYACGLPRPISVPLDVLADELAAGLTSSGGPRNRAELPGSTLTKSAHPVGGIALVSHGDSVHASIEPLAARDALTASLSASTSLADPVLLRQVFPLSAALARLPGWSLRHGTDADSRLEQASCCLEEIRRLLDEMSTS